MISAWATQASMSISFVIAVCSFSSVIVFIQRYLVPHVSRIDVVYTYCQVSEIREDHSSGCIQVITAHPTDNGTGFGLAFLHADKPSPSKQNCFCSNCKARMMWSNQAVQWGGGRHLMVGEEMTCFYRLSQLDPLSPLRALFEAKQVMSPEDYSNQWRLFHAMFWPTAIFVVSLVSLFFSCIRHLEESEQRNLRRTSFCLKSYAANTNGFGHPV